MFSQQPMNLFSSSEKRLKYFHIENRANPEGSMKGDSICPSNKVALFLAGLLQCALRGTAFEKCSKTPTGSKSCSQTEAGYREQMTC